MFDFTYEESISEKGASAMKTLASMLLIAYLSAAATASAEVL